jgi:allantoicase
MRRFFRKALIWLAKISSSQLASRTEDDREPRGESVLKPNRPLKAKLGDGWEAKRARITSSNDDE